MQYILPLILICTLVQFVVAPPVNKKTKDGEHNSENEVDDAEEMVYIIEYRRYLMEVVQILDNDPDFRAKLEKADEADISTGKIADQLQFVNHNVRTRLDEIKRDELERLKHLLARENEIKNGLDVDHLKIAEHLDHTNTRTFEILDLKKLIAKTTNDLAEANIKRREEFKQHEMEVKYDEQEKLKHMDDMERIKYEQELEALKEKHKNHEPVHHPGSKQQLEEVWEKQDHMDPKDFNPKTFFYMHDIDGNGVWDQDEVKALFLKELDKLYAQGASKEELLKRAEEMERMREHVFYEADLNKDEFISYDEFLEQTKKPDFQRDEGWQGLDEQQIYTPEEYEAFARHKQEEIQRMIAKGMFPPQYVHPGVPQDFQHDQQFQDHPQQYHQQQPQLGLPQHQYPNHLPVQPVHEQLSQQQHVQGQIGSDHQYQQLQMPQQGQVPVQQHHGQIPVPQHQAQVPVQQHQAQVPIQQHQGQVPVQRHQGQVPVQQPQGQIPVNNINHVPQSVQGNAASQQHSQLNVQPGQPSAQLANNRNNIQIDGKV
ncbi:Nucleobindin-2 [Dufourea novaeangliae]|uniref:Nucleobindin-2 n=1 Tax=Dufourea novaeangliae TaxID=178035 RepID=A0A154NYR6_DUFNO|nr:Nucleobindin-2 [Dufourea novaeangliae]